MLEELVKLKNFSKLAAKLTIKLAPKGRFHVSNKKITKLSWPTPRHQGIADYKPLGMWYGIGDSWIRFLERDAKYGGWSLKEIDDFSFIYKIKINSKNILHLRTRKDFASFVKYFGVCLPAHGAECNCLINWEMVTQGYSGIEVHDYKYWMDDHLWWNNWDCASGCIWSEKALKEIKVVREF